MCWRGLYSIFNLKLALAAYKFRDLGEKWEMGTDEHNTGWLEFNNLNQTFVIQFLLTPNKETFIKPNTIW